MNGMAEHIKLQVFGCWHIKTSLDKLTSPDLRTSCFEPTYRHTSAKKIYYSIIGFNVQKIQPVVSTLLLCRCGVNPFTILLPHIYP